MSGLSPSGTGASLFCGYKSQCIFFGLKLGWRGPAIGIPDQADGDQMLFDLTVFIPVSVLSIPL